MRSQDMGVQIYLPDEEFSSIGHFPVAELPTPNAERIDNLR
jgi:hypothetical protein